MFAAMKMLLVYCPWTWAGGWQQTKDGDTGEQREVCKGIGEQAQRRSILVPLGVHIANNLLVVVVILAQG